MDREKLIEKYMQGRLSDAEQAEFERLLNSDTDFKTDVEFQSNLKRVTEAEDDEKFRQLLSEFEDEVSPQKSNFRTIPTKWLAAASVALLLTLGYFFIFNPTLSPQELFIENFEPYPNVVHPIVRSGGDVSPKNDAFTAYQNGEYEKASAMFSKLYEETGESPYLFYSGNALIQLNRGTEAIPVLEKHLKTKDGLSDKTAWYMAMAYLQIGDTDNAKKMLEMVVVDNEYQAESARKLLKSLK